ncbi:MAG: hypothetical protein QXY39_04665 [Thermofilaceae archaeon]
MSLETLITIRLAKAFDYLAVRAGGVGKYKRFKEETYHPILGRTKSFWEEVETRVIAIKPQQGTVQLPESIVDQVNSIFALKKSAFKLQPGETGPITPKPGDELEFNGELWTSDLGGRVYYWTDPTGEVWFVAMRRV